MERRGLIWTAVGLALAGMAYARPGSVIGGVAWMAAVLVACRGFGIVFERVVRLRTSSGLTVAAGLVVMGIVSFGLAACRVLSLHVQVAVVLIGCVLAGLARAEGAAGRKPPVATIMFLIAAGFSLLAAGLLMPEPVIGDVMNHALVVKRLWDTGATGVIHHHVALGIIGESYFAIAIGAHAICVFESGVAPLLLIAIAWGELATSDDPFALPIWWLLAVPVALFPGVSQHWVGVLWYVAAFLALRRALAEGRGSPHSILFAVALAGTRYEYLLIAITFAMAAVALPHIAQMSRRVAVFAVTSWFVASVVVQLLMLVGVWAAIENSLLLVLALPMIAIVVSALGSGWRSAIAVAVGATLTYRLAVALDAIPVTIHRDIALFTCWFGAALAIVLSIDSTVLRRTPRSMHPIAAAAAIAIFVAQISIGPNFDGTVRQRYVVRLERAVLAASNLREIGDVTSWAAVDVRAAQDEVPAGVRLGFWGKSAGLLDFRRNAIVDLSWPARLTYDSPFLAQLDAENLARVDYVIVEDIESLSVTDQWGSAHPSPISNVETQLEPLPGLGIARAFRVRR